MAREVVVGDVRDAWSAKAAGVVAVRPRPTMPCANASHKRAVAWALGNRQAKRKRLTSFSGGSYNLRFVSGMICGTVPGTGFRKTIYFKE
jgi:hypothetical protein